MLTTIAFCVQRVHCLDNAGGPPRENYVPPAPPEDENEMYNSLQRGINFNKYDSIPVEVSGENCPKPIQTFEQAHLTDTIAVCRCSAF